MKDQFIPQKDWRDFILTFRNLEADTACGFDWIESVQQYLECALGDEYTRDLLAIHRSILQNVRRLRQILNDDIYYLDLQPKKEREDLPF